MLSLSRIQTDHEKLTSEILRDAENTRRSRRCTWKDYERHKRLLQALNLEPGQYALACGMLAKILGV